MFSEGMCILVKCPNCGKEMEEGTLHTRNYPFWTQQELRFFRAPTDTVELGPIGDDHQRVYTGSVPGIFPCHALPGMRPCHLPVQLD